MLRTAWEAEQPSRGPALPLQDEALWSASLSDVNTALCGVDRLQAERQAAIQAVAERRTEAEAEAEAEAGAEAAVGVGGEIEQAKEYSWRAELSDVGACILADEDTRASAKLSGPSATVLGAFERFRQARGLARSRSVPDAGVLADAGPLPGPGSALAATLQALEASAEAKARVAQAATEEASAQELTKAVAEQKGHIAKREAAFQKVWPRQRMAELLPPVLRGQCRAHGRDCAEGAEACDLRR